MKTNTRIHDTNEPIVSHACWANNVAAVTRMCLTMPRHDPEVYKHFKQWWYKVLKNEIVPFMGDVKVDHIAWFNKLSASKQNEVKDYYIEDKASSQTIKTINKHDI
jgi:hypothetical protein